MDTSSWIIRCLRPSRGGSVFASEAYAAYSEECLFRGHTPLVQTHFGRLVQSLHSGVRVSRTNLKGKKQRVYNDIILKLPDLQVREPCISIHEIQPLFPQGWNLYDTSEQNLVCFAKNLGYTVSDSKLTLYLTVKVTGDIEVAIGSTLIDLKEVGISQKISLTKSSVLDLLTVVSRLQLCFGVPWQLVSNVSSCRIDDWVYPDNHKEKRKRSPNCRRVCPMNAVTNSCIVCKKLKDYHAKHGLSLVPEDAEDVNDVFEAALSSATPQQATLIKEEIKKSKVSICANHASKSAESTGPLLGSSMDVSEKDAIHDRTVKKEVISPTGFTNATQPPQISPGTGKTSRNKFVVGKNEGMNPGTGILRTEKKDEMEYSITAAGFTNTNQVPSFSSGTGIPSPKKFIVAKDKSLLGMDSLKGKEPPFVSTITKMSVHLEKYHDQGSYREIKVVTPVYRSNLNQPPQLLPQTLPHQPEPLQLLPQPLPLQPPPLRPQTLPSQPLPHQEEQECGKKTLEIFQTGKSIKIEPDTQNPKQSEMVGIDEHHMNCQMSIQEEYESFYCPLCNKIYLDEYEYNFHWLAHPVAKIIYKCSICDKTFPTKNSLEQHEEIHQKETTVQYSKGASSIDNSLCRIPDSLINTNLVQEYRKIAPKPSVPSPVPVLFWCNQCGIKFQNSDILQIHKEWLHENKEQDTSTDSVIVSPLLQTETRIIVPSQCGDKPQETPQQMAQLGSISGSSLKSEL